MPSDRISHACITCLIVALLLLAGCTRETASSTITVFAASSLTDALTEVAGLYEAEHPGVDVQLNFGASSQLATQLIEGAPADIFASANEDQMRRVIEAGRVSPDAVRVLAGNRLVLVVPADNPAAIATLADLAQPGLRLVTAAAEVPIGRYTREALFAMDASGDFSPGFAAAVLANVVSEEANVRQVVAKVQLGEADAAIVYASDVTPTVRDEVRVIPIPDGYNVLARYPIAPLRDAPTPDRAADFLAFVLSDDGQAILRAWGFLAP